MSTTENPGFGKFIPGFEFLQNLAQSPTHAAMPNLTSWVAPTMNVEELDKRIQELKAVSFWLDQNCKALNATVQALEVQKMTLVTLQGMNFSVGDMTKAFSDQADEAPNTTDAQSTETEKGASSQAANKPAQSIDPQQWWVALTQQFQQIASQTLSAVANAQAQEAGKFADANSAAVVKTKKPATKAAKKTAARQSST